MTEDITIRKAVCEDIEKITEYNLQMARETEDRRLNRRLVLNGVAAVIKDPRKGFYLIAEKRAGQNGIIAQLMITFEGSDWRNKCIWWIQSVYVDRKFRNQKIFTSLYRELLKLARSREDIGGLRLYVQEHNESAKKVYEALGMNKTSYEIFEMFL